MTESYIRYDILTQEALRSVVRTVLTDTAEKGLPGEHHFFISFDTRAEGVMLSPRLKAQFPEEMTIVLQHVFWDLVVTDTSFEVGLTFSQIPERLVVPFAAITRFEDRFAGFDVHFMRDDEAEAASTPAASEFAMLPTSEAKPAPAKPEPGTATPASAPPDQPSTGGEVVRLDRFRKK